MICEFELPHSTRTRSNESRALKTLTLGGSPHEVVSGIDINNRKRTAKLSLLADGEQIIRDLITRIVVGDTGSIGSFLERDLRH